jgi:outer membrane protein assembly factor BamB
VNRLLPWALAGVAMASIAAYAGAPRTERTAPDERTASTKLRRPPPDAPAPRLRITGPAIVTVESGMSSLPTFTITDRGAGGHLDVGYDGAGFSGPPMLEAVGGGRYRVRLQVPANLATGLYRGMLTARVCQETPCETPIAGTTARAQYRVHVRWINRGEWETFQRDAAHSGYVPIVVNPALIMPAWQFAPDDFALGDVTTSATTGRGIVLISRLDEERGSSVSALRESDGHELWRRSFQSMTPVAVHGGRAYVGARSGGEYTLWSLNAADGMPRFQTSYDGDFYGEITPVVDAGIVQMGISHPFGPVSAIEADGGSPLWTAPISGGVGAMPAVRDGISYLYDGSALRILDASDGAELVTIDDPYEDEGNLYSASGAPMLGTPDHVVVLGGTDSTIGRPLVNFSPSAGEARWRSVKRYHTVPAMAGGIVYAASNAPRALDAIDEATGQVLWSWAPSESEAPFVHNIVVTRNLVFASTRTRLYAIDLSSHSEVWSAPTPGWISISGGGTLYVRRNINSGFSIETRAFRLH